MYQLFSSPSLSPSLQLGTRAISMDEETRAVVGSRVCKKNVHCSPAAFLLAVSDEAAYISPFVPPLWMFPVVHS